MDFSDQYRRIMYAFTAGTYAESFPSLPLNNSLFPVMAIFELTNWEGEIPTFLHRLILAHERLSGTHRIVFPMSVVPYHRTFAGADAILKEFCLHYEGGRLTKAVTNKGEVYYGSRGVIFDKDFNPLMYTTEKINYASEHIVNLTDYKLHVHPQVFLNDSAVLNKAILKKATAYFLSNGIDDGWGRPKKEVSIVVDDGSKFFKRPNVPDINANTEDFSAVLKDNIKDILDQLKYT